MQPQRRKPPNVDGRFGSPGVADSQPMPGGNVEYRLVNCAEFAWNDDGVASELNLLAKHGWRVHTYDFKSRQVLMERNAA